MEKLRNSIAQSRAPGISYTERGASAIVEAGGSGFAIHGDAFYRKIGWTVGSAELQIETVAVEPEKT